MEKKYYLRMAVAVLLLIIGLTFVFSYASQAAPAIQIPVEEFSGLGGSAAYIRYYGNYFLDVKESSNIILGQVARNWNDLTNMIFTVVKTFGVITVIIFYWCMDFDLSYMFHDQLSNMQAALKEGIFEPLFILGFCGSAIILLKKMLQRDMMGAYGQIVKVVGITILSVLVVRDSASVISAATNITKTVGTQVLVGIQGRDNVTITSYAAQTAAELWNNMVHVPWEFFEFGGEEHEGGIVYQILSLSYGSQERQDIVNSYNGDAFNEKKIAEKIGIVTIYLIPLSIKCVIYILLALLTLVCQLIAIFYVLLAPLVLIMSMMPGYEGLISAWLRKMLESQLSMLIVYFLMGLITKFDNMLYEACAGSWGWIVVMVVELIIEILIFIKRDELLGTLSNIQRSVTPQYAKTMMLRGTNAFQLADRGINVGAKVVGVGIKNGKVGTAVNTVQNIKSVEKSKEKKKVVQESGEQTLQKKEAEVSNTRQKNTGEQAVVKSQQVHKQEYHVYADEDSKDGKKRVTVERPVMIVSWDSNVIDIEFPNSSVGYEALNTPENAQEPHKEVLRPRMENGSNVIQFEAYRANLESDSESETVELQEQVDIRQGKMQKVASTISNQEMPEERPQVKRQDAEWQNVKNQESEQIARPKQTNKESSVKKQKSIQKKKPKDVVVQNNAAAASEAQERHKTEKKTKKIVQRPRYSDISAGAQK